MGELLALSEKYHLAPEWWLEHSPAWLAEARKQIMLTSRITEMISSDHKTAADLGSYAKSLGGGGEVKLITGADV